MTREVNHSLHLPAHTLDLSIYPPTSPRVTVLNYNTVSSKWKPFHNLLSSPTTQGFSASSPACLSTPPQSSSITVLHHTHSPHIHISLGLQIHTHTTTLLCPLVCPLTHSGSHTTVPFMCLSCPADKLPVIFHISTKA